MAHLIPLRVCPLRLQRNDFRQAWQLVDVVTPPDALVESEGQEERLDIAESDIGVRLAAQDSSEQALMAIQCDAPSWGPTGCPGRT